MSCDSVVKICVAEATLVTPGKTPRPVFARISTLRRTCPIPADVVAVVEGDAEAIVPATKKPTRAKKVPVKAE